MSQPLVLALCGLPGAGKSTLARCLLDELPLREINRDTIRQALFPLCAFSGAEKNAANEAVSAALVANCQLAFSSLIDGMTFSTADQRHGFARLAHREGARFLLLHLDCPADVAQARLATADRHPAGDRNTALVNHVQQRFEPPGDEALRLDATLPAVQVHELALHAIRSLLDQN